MTEATLLEAGEGQQGGVGFVGRDGSLVTPDDGGCVVAQGMHGAAGEIKHATEGAFVQDGAGQLKVGVGDCTRRVFPRDQAFLDLSGDGKAPGNGRLGGGRGEPHTAVA